MKILYITAEGFDTPNPNNQMAEVMIREFLKNGNSVHLIQSHRKGVYEDIPDSLRGKENFTVDTIVRNVVDKTNFIKRYLNDVRYAFLAMKYWRKVKDADVIYLQSNPTILYPMLLLRIFKRKLPIVYSIYDVFPGHAYDIGVVTSKLIYKLMLLMQKPCYHMPAAITVLSEDMKNKVVEQGAKPDDVYVIPAWYDTSTAREVSDEENKFFKKYNLSRDKFRIQFAGTIGYVFNYKTIIELAKRVKKYDDIEIQIVGDGNVKADLIEEAKELELNNISFYPLQPIDIVPDVYSACDICIIPLKKGVIGNGVPSKAPILMACKRLIVNSVEIESNYAKMYSKHNMGIAVDIDDYDALANSIVEIKNKPKTMEAMIENAYDYGKEHYASDKSINKLMSVFETVRGN